MLVALEYKVFITTCTYLHVMFQNLHNFIYRYMCDAWNYISSVFSFFHSYNETRAPKTETNRYAFTVSNETGVKADVVSFLRVCRHQIRVVYLTETRTYHRN